MRSMLKVNLLIFVLSAAACLMGCEAVQAQQSLDLTGASADTSGQWSAASTAASPATGSGGAESWTGQRENFSAGEQSFGARNAAAWTAGTQSFSSAHGGGAGAPGFGTGSAMGTGVFGAMQGIRSARGTGTFMPNQATSWVAGEHNFGSSAQPGGIWVARPTSGVTIGPAGRVGSASSYGESLSLLPTPSPQIHLSSASAATQHRNSSQGLGLRFAKSSHGGLTGNFGGGHSGNGLQGHAAFQGFMTRGAGHGLGFHSASTNSRQTPWKGMKPQ